MAAVVETRGTVTDAELAQHVRDRLADFKVPARFTFVDELPRDPNGKVMKRSLRSDVWASARAQDGATPKR